MAGGMPWRCAEEAGGCGGRRRCVHVRRAAVGPRVECIDECILETVLETVYTARGTQNRQPKDYRPFQKYAR